MASSQIERDILKSFEDKRNGLMRVKNPDHRILKILLEGLRRLSSLFDNSSANWENALIDWLKLITVIQERCNATLFNEYIGKYTEVFFNLLSIANSPTEVKHRIAHTWLSCLQRATCSTTWNAKLCQDEEWVYQQLLKNLLFEISNYNLQIKIVVIFKKVLPSFLEIDKNFLEVINQDERAREKFLKIPDDVISTVDVRDYLNYINLYVNTQWSILPLIAEKIYYGNNIDTPQYIDTWVNFNLSSEPTISFGAKQVPAIDEYELPLKKVESLKTENSETHYKLIFETNALFSNHTNGTDPCTVTFQFPKNENCNILKNEILPICVDYVSKYTNSSIMLSASDDYLGQYFEDRQKLLEDFISASDKNSNCSPVITHHEPHEDQRKMPSECDDNLGQYFADRQSLLEDFISASDKNSNCMQGVSHYEPHEDQSKIGTGKKRKLYNTENKSGMKSENSQDSQALKNKLMTLKQSQLLKSGIANNTDNGDFSRHLSSAYPINNMIAREYEYDNNGYSTDVIDYDSQNKPENVTDVPGIVIGQTTTKIDSKPTILNESVVKNVSHLNEKTRHKTQKYKFFKSKQSLLSSDDASKKSVKPKKTRIAPRKKVNKKGKTAAIVENNPIFENLNHGITDMSMNKSITMENADDQVKANVPSVNEISQNYTIIKPQKKQINRSTKNINISGQISVTPNNLIIITPEKKQNNRRTQKFNTSKQNNAPKGILNTSKTNDIVNLVTDDMDTCSEIDRPLSSLIKQIKNSILKEPKQKKTNQTASKTIAVSSISPILELNELNDNFKANISKYRNFQKINSHLMNNQKTGENNLMPNGIYKISEGNNPAENTQRPGGFSGSNTTVTETKMSSGSYNRSESNNQRLTWNTQRPGEKCGISGSNTTVTETKMPSGSYKRSESNNQRLAWNTQRPGEKSGISGSNTTVTETLLEITKIIKSQEITYNKLNKNQDENVGNIEGSHEAPTEFNISQNFDNNAILGTSSSNSDTRFQISPLETATGQGLNKRNITLDNCHSEMGKTRKLSHQIYDDWEMPLYSAINSVNCESSAQVSSVSVRSSVESHTTKLKTVRFDFSEKSPERQESSDHESYIEVDDDDATSSLRIREVPEMNKYMNKAMELFKPTTNECNDIQKMWKNYQSRKLNDSLKRSIEEFHNLNKEVKAKERKIENIKANFLANRKELIANSEAVKKLLGSVIKDLKSSKKAEAENQKKISNEIKKLQKDYAAECNNSRNVILANYVAETCDSLKQKYCDKLDITI